MQKQWQKNDIIIHRYVGHHDWVTWGRPHIVIQDDSDLVILYQPAGTRVERFDRLDKKPLRTWKIEMNVLRFMFPNCPYAVLLCFDSGQGVPSYYPHFNWPHGDFKGWKVDLESPFHRSEIGFDTTDNALDVIVRPDYTWHWKDTDFSARLEAGVYFPKEVEGFFEDGREAIKSMEKREVPFCDPWPQWEPPKDVTIPVCMPGWESVGSPEIDRNREAPRTLFRFKDVE